MDQYSDYSVSDISSTRIPWAQPDLESPVDRNGDGVFRLRLETEEGGAGCIGEFLWRLRLRFWHGVGTLAAGEAKNLNYAQESECKRGGDGRRSVL